MSLAKLLAVKLDRRSIGAAVFVGQHLDYTQVRQLSGQRDKAQASVIGFITWLIHNFGITSATLECSPNANENQRAVLSQAVIATLRDNAVSVWEISKGDLLAGFGHPALKSRAELREVVRTIWQTKSNKGSALDAAALGLYVQTERMFLK